VTATRPPLEPLLGGFVRLDPMTADDLPDLARVLRRPEVFAGGYGGGPAGLPGSDEEMRVWLADYYGPGARNDYVVRIATGPDAGAVIGATTLGDLDEANEHAHLGWTAYAPEVWGTVVNPEAKLLLLGTAFGHGYGRVKIQADSVNARSRAAILKLGAVFEGVVRRDRLRPDGTWRDSAVYSILVDEWPAVRAGLEARIAAWGERPVTLG